MRILSFGGGVQTTALAILAAKGEVEVDAVVFADTKGEKPETYEYMRNITVPLLNEENIPFHWLMNESKYDGSSLYAYSWNKQYLPGMPVRQCSLHFKVNVIKRAFPKVQKLIGFSKDEVKRADNPVHKDAVFPLIEMNLSGADCIRLIRDYGYPTPTKSSCFFCPFQRPWEWNWIKSRHPDLFQKALDLETHVYEKHPYKRNQYGLFGGKPLWKFAEGVQQSFDITENSCWSGSCGH